MRLIKAFAIALVGHVAGQYLLWPFGLATPPIYTVWTAASFVLYALFVVTIASVASRAPHDVNRRHVLFVATAVILRAVVIGALTDTSRILTSGVVLFFLELPRGLMFIGLPYLLVTALKLVKRDEG